MEVAHDLTELQELISRLGLKDERRQSARYNLEIAGTYYTGQRESPGAQGKCWLVDVSKEGISIRLNDTSVQPGTIMYLELPMSGRTVGVSSRVVHVQPEKGFYTVGLKSTSDSDDIIQQLFSS